MPDGVIVIVAEELDLAQALTRMFEPAQDDLKRLVRRSTGHGLYEVYTFEKQPLQGQVTELLDRLRARGEIAAFLKAVLLARPDARGLHALIHSAYPELAGGLPRAAAQVALVASGIDAARAELGDTAIAEPLRAARDELERLALGIGYLAAYKLLHDGFQKLQLQLPQLMREAARLATAPDAWIQIEASWAAIEAMRVDAEKLAGFFAELPAGTPLNTPGDRAAEARLVARIARLVDGFDAAIVANDAAAGLRVAEESARLIRMETKRLELLMFSIAGTLPLPKLVEALEAVLVELERRPGGAGAAALAAAVNQLELLRSALGWQIEVHHLWQEAENELWAAEDVLRNERNAVRDEARDEFALLWGWARAKHRQACRHDPSAPWIKPLDSLASVIEGRFVTWVPEQMQGDFSKYRIRALSRFYEVDRTLRAHCDAIVVLDRPLREMLRELRS